MSENKCATPYCCRPPGPGQRYCIVCLESGASGLPPEAFEAATQVRLLCPCPACHKTLQENHCCVQHTEWQASPDGKFHARLTVNWFFRTGS